MAWPYPACSDAQLVQPGSALSAQANSAKVKERIANPGRLTEAQGKKLTPSYGNAQIARRLFEFRLLECQGATSKSCGSCGYWLRVWS